MTGLREKTIKVLESLDVYYQDLGADKYDAIAEEIQIQCRNLPSSQDPVDFLKIVEYYRKQLNLLDIIPSRREYDRIRLLLDRLISVIRMKYLLEMLEECVDDDDYSRKFNLEQLEYDHEKNHSEVTYEDEDGLEATLETLEEYAKDDDVYVG
jgi:hypothetical protein